MVHPSVEQRFWASVKKTRSCWLWTASTSGGGYGQIWVGPKRERAHRLSWILHFGAIPAGMQIRHRCDNPRCVRPSHLLLGTRNQNIQDAVRRGRHRNGRRYLTEQQVREIRAKHKRGGETYGTLAAAYGVGYGTIADIITQRRWRHV